MCADIACPRCESLEWVVEISSISATNGPQRYELFCAVCRFGIRLLVVASLDDFDGVRTFVKGNVSA